MITPLVIMWNTSPWITLLLNVVEKCHLPHTELQQDYNSWEMKIKIDLHACIYFRYVGIVNLQYIIIIFV